MSTPKIGSYELQREIGRGGMAVVYLARDPAHNRAVAIKILPREFMFDPKFRARFQRETKVIRSLKSPGIVPIYDFGEHEGQPYMVMRYMSGGSLKQRIGGKPPSMAEIALIFSQVAPVLDEAHRRGLIHRDIKPDNILFDEDNLAYLADFGIVKMTEGQSVALTTQGGVLGTPAFMSPEQVVGKVKLDGRSDVYALGVILYHMLTGHVPYQADTPMSQAMMHVLEPLPNILEVRPNLPDETQLVIEKAMAKDRNDRYPTATALAKSVGDLAELAGDKPAIIAPVKAQRRRMPVSVVLGGLFALFCLVISAGAVYLFTSGQDDEPASRPSIFSATNTPATAHEPAETVGPPATAALLLPGGSSSTGSTEIDSAGVEGLLPTLRATRAESGLTPTDARSLLSTVRPSDTPRPPSQSTNGPPPPPPTSPPPQPPTNTSVPQATPVPPPTNTQPPPPTNTQPPPPTNTQPPPPTNTQPPP